EQRMPDSEAMAMGGLAYAPSRRRPSKSDSSHNTKPSLRTNHRSQSLALWNLRSMVSECPFAASQPNRPYLPVLSPASAATRNPTPLSLNGAVILLRELARHSPA